jgi:tRNA dimethylallyltransferase
VTAVLVVVGTTASGKSELGIQLALRLGGEVVSADSRQVYRGLDIGTGKVTHEERRGVEHHLLDVADVRQRFTVAEYQRQAFAAIDDIHTRGHLPLLVGGSGLYVRAVVDNPAYPPTADPELRGRLEATPISELVAQLQQVDPEAAAHIDLHNPRRVVRALEVTLATGRSFWRQRHVHPTARVQALHVGLTWPREELRRRIHARLYARLAASPSMLDETRDLLSVGVPPERLIELGLEYRFLTRHLLGELSYEEMVVQLETAIAQFARRQLTWFRRDPRIHWLDPTRAPTQAEALWQASRPGSGAEPCGLRRPNTP